MRVLFITSTFPLSEKDPQVPWMGELVRRLVKRGLDIEIFAPASRGSPSHSFYGLKVYRFRYAPRQWEILTHDEGSLFRLRSNKWLFFLPFLYFLFGILSIIKISLKNKYDVIHVHWPFPQGILGIVAKIATRARLIYSIYGAEFALVVRVPFGKFIFSQLIKRADSIIGISNYTANRIKEIEKVSVNIIPFNSPINEKRIGKYKKKKERPAKILFVGRLIERKGIEYLILAMQQILKKIDVHLDIVGQGPLFNDLRKKINNLSLDRKVTLWGKVDNARLHQMYLGCDVFVLPAIVDKWGDTEGLGVVLLEAMSFKKPVVASNIGGITDIVKNGETGLLVPQKDAQRLAWAIEKLLTNDKLRRMLSEKGYEHVKRNFNWNHIINKTIKLYQAN